MRVIAGRLKGRKLLAGDGPLLRPTQERVREAVFNILPRDLEGARVLDLYAGVGAMGIEALSRGAALVILVDSGWEAAKSIKRNLEQLGLLDQARLIKKRVEPGLKILAAEGRKFDLIFMDPPYDRNETAKAMRSILELDILAPDGRLVVETGSSPPEDPPGLVLTDQRRYGGTTVSFYELKENGREET